MKTRDHDAPVMILQILPVNTAPSKQSLRPQKPPDFSFLKNFVQICRDASAWMIKTGRQATMGTQHPHSLSDIDASVIGQSAPSLTHGEIDHFSADISASTARVPNIVVSDLALLSVDNRNSIDQAETLQPPSPADVKRRLEVTKDAIVTRWLHEKERLAAIKSMTLTRFYSAIDASRQSLLTARGGSLRKGWSVSRLFNGKVKQISKTTRKSKLKIEQELMHDVEITKSTLFAQQHALENVTVQLNAVQKELARHKTMLAGLVAQVEAIDLKIAQSVQTPPRRPKPTTDAGHSRRPVAKKNSLPVERPREQRA